MAVTNETPELRNVVVTGAAGALGQVVVETFLAAGCTVVGWDVGVDGEGLRADAERERLRWERVDLTQSAAVRQAVANVEAELGSIDALIHCAGGFRWAKIEDVTDEDVDFLMGVNLRSTLYVLREVVPGMKQRRFGRIVLLSSKSTQQPGLGEGAYAATKAGLNALTSSVSREVKGHNVTINALQPTIIDTPANREAMPDGDFERWVKREQLGEIIFGLTQPLGAPLNGALIAVTGGM